MRPVGCNTVTTALRGSKHQLWEKTIEPQLAKVPEAERERALEMVNMLMKDRCPSN